MTSIKNEKIRWILTGATIGIALGISIGVMLSGGNQGTSEKSFEKASKAAGSLGWAKLEEYVNITETLVTIENLEPLKNDISNYLKNNYSESFSDNKTNKELPVITKSSSISKIPTFENLKKSDISPSFSNKKYKDGIGEISIFDATLEQIDKIKYISKPAAEAVYSHVQSNKISNFDELLDLKGVGPKTVMRLRENFHIK